MSKSISVAEVAEHKNADSGMYIIIDSNVYDVTSKFMFGLECNQA
jgi:cytochrome b involved in lipid metabolism